MLPVRPAAALAGDVPLPSETPTGDVRCSRSPAPSAIAANKKAASPVPARSAAATLPSPRAASGASSRIDAAAEATLPSPAPPLEPRPPPEPPSDGGTSQSPAPSTAAVAARSPAPSAAPASRRKRHRVEASEARAKLLPEGAPSPMDVLCQKARMNLSRIEGGEGSLALKDEIVPPDVLHPAAASTPVLLSKKKAGKKKAALPVPSATIHHPDVTSTPTLSQFLSSMPGSKRKRTPRPTSMPEDERAEQVFADDEAEEDVGDRHGQPAQGHAGEASETTAKLLPEGARSVELFDGNETDGGGYDWGYDSWRGEEEDEDEPADNGGVEEMVDEHGEENRKYRSKVWTEFSKVRVAGIVTKAQCIHCNVEISAKRGSGTSAMGNHLKRCKVRRSVMNIENQLKSTVMSPEGVALKEWRFSQEVSMRELDRMISLHGMPFSVVEYDMQISLHGTSCRCSGDHKHEWKICRLGLPQEP